MKNITVIAIIIMAFFVSCNNRTKQADVNANTKDTLISYEGKPPIKYPLSLYL